MRRDVWIGEVLRVTEPLDSVVQVGPPVVLEDKVSLCWSGRMGGAGGGGGRWVFMVAPRSRFSRPGGPTVCDYSNGHDITASLSHLSLRWEHE